MDTDSFLVYIKTDYIYKDIAEDIETRFDTSNDELDRPLPKGKNKNVIGLINDKLGEKFIVFFLFFLVKRKTYGYSIGDSSEDNKAKGTIKCALKNKL